MSGKNIIPSFVEALILASPEPLAGRKIANMRDDLTPSKVAKAVAELNSRYNETGSSFRIRELAGGYQFYILPEFTGYVEDLFTRHRKMRLTKPALETLAVVAYKQPVTKAQVEHVRGVASDGVLHNLLEKKMITITGRADSVGRPLQYGTTDEFLKFFGLARLDDLPKMSEIEELIRASEPENQQQLTFATDALDQQMQRKLNVADGTFDPSTREESVEQTDTTESENSSGDKALEHNVSEKNEEAPSLDQIDPVEELEAESVDADESNAELITEATPEAVVTDS